MLALILVLLPLAGSVLLLLLKGNTNTSKNVAIGTSLATFAIAIYAFTSFNAQVPVEIKYSWMKDLNINFHLSLDGISLLMVTLTAFLVPLIILSTYKHSYKNHATFYALILLAETALMGVFMARDIFLFYFLSLLSSQCLSLLLGCPACRHTVSANEKGLWSGGEFETRLPERLPI